MCSGRFWTDAFLADGSDLLEYDVISEVVADAAFTFGRGGYH